MTKKSANVRIRASNTFRTVSITSDNKPEIIDAVTAKWQRIITLIARLLEVPAALIMRIDDGYMQVFLKSENEDNPYQKGDSDKLGNGLYCETVIGTEGELLVTNSLENPVWKDNPDIKLEMISYYGLPIHWPDAETFGTICVLDCKENPYNETFKKLMTEFRLSIEKDLELLINSEMLKAAAERDTLTPLYNRRKTSEILKTEYERSKRYKTPLTIALLNLDQFKRINDQHGHDIGDIAILGFSEVVSSRVRNTDVFGRWGGDEFLLICPNTSRDGVTCLLRDIGGQIDVEIGNETIEIGFSFGIAEWEENDTDVGQLVGRADRDLYKEKALKLA